MKNPIIERTTKSVDKINIVLNSIMFYFLITNIVFLFYIYTMNKIKTFEQFVNENIQINEIFGIPGTPTFKELWEKIKGSLQKLSLTILSKGLTCWDTLVTFVKGMLDNAKSLKEKYPVVYRTIMITAVLLIIFFMLTSAGVSGQPIPPEKINAAIGLIEEIQKSGNYADKVDDSVFSKSIAYLMELKRGNTIQVGEKSKEIAENAIKLIDDMIKTTKDVKTTDVDKNETMEVLLSLAEKGAKYVSYNITTITDDAGNLKGEYITMGKK
jgi:hypothetical protein